MNPKVRVSQDARTAKQNNIDEKQKKKIINAILADNPHLAKDTLQNYYLERMVESYLIDPNNFNRMTSEAIKQDKKRGEEVQRDNPLPKEIICITKEEAGEVDTKDVIPL